MFSEFHSQNDRSSLETNKHSAYYTPQFERVFTGSDLDFQKHNDIQTTIHSYMYTS